VYGLGQAVRELRVHQSSGAVGEAAITELEADLGLVEVAEYATPASTITRLPSEVSSGDRRGPKPFDYFAGVVQALR
jgi:hypothetical protein